MNLTGIALPALFQTHISWYLLKALVLVTVMCYCLAMFEAAINEFPFVEGMPKREKSKVAKIWELFAFMKSVSQTEGELVPLTMACKLLDVSRSRIDQFVQDGRLKRVEFDGHVFITENSLVELAKVERVNGRPAKKLTVKELWKASMDASKDLVK
jgi:hypothetical protein